MFWNTEFLDSTQSHIDVLLQMGAVKLADILFEEDLLQELKTFNVRLGNFLTKPEVISELVDNITRLTERDCCDKSLYSRVHSAYLSCEILSSGSQDIFCALINNPESLRRIFRCLVDPPNTDLTSITEPCQVVMKANDENKQCEDQIHDTQDVAPEDPQEIETGSDDKPSSISIEKTSETITKQSSTEQSNETIINEAKEDECTVVKDKLDEVVSDSKEETNGEVDTKGSTSDETIENKESIPQDEAKDCGHMNNHDTSTINNNNNNNVNLIRPPLQKITLVSKLINTIHSLGPENLSCFITKEMETFSRLVDTLVHNIDTSGSIEILSTFINRTSPSEFRYIFCEVLCKLNFINKLIDVMTLSEVEDKQRNACQLLCDIIVIGRQEPSEQTDSNQTAQDMLSESLESKEALTSVLRQMFSKDELNQTAIICGLKFLQILIEKKSNVEYTKLVNKTVETVQDQIEEYLPRFHELLVNPPRQEPIKTTFGVIQKPLGYLRFEVVNFIRALIGTNCPKLIRKLIELKTIGVIIDLFIEYSWNNLLHTQVEQALCLVIKNCRQDDDDSQDGGIGDVKDVEKSPSQALLAQLLNECDLIGRLLTPDKEKQNLEQANFGHIVQIINSIAINRDLDTIREHMNELKDKKPELFDRWTKFVDVDVASFKEISIYYDAHSANIVNSLANNQRFARHLQPDPNLSLHNPHINNISTIDMTTSHTNNNSNKTSDNNETSSSTSSPSNSSDLSKSEYGDAINYHIDKMLNSIYPRINKDVIPRIRRGPKSAH